MLHWTEGYCGAILQLVQALAAMPAVDPSTPQRASRTSRDLLDSMLGGLDGTLDGLKGLGPSPVPAGDGVRKDAITTFSGIRSRVADAKARLDSASADTEAIRQALGGASAPLDELAKVNLMQGFNAVPELAEAGKRAPSCAPLTAGVTPASRRLAGSPRRTQGTI